MVDQCRGVLLERFVALLEADSGFPQGFPHALLLGLELLLVGEDHLHPLVLLLIDFEEFGGCCFCFFVLFFFCLFSCLVLLPSKVWILSLLAFDEGNMRKSTGVNSSHM